MTDELKDIFDALPERVQWAWIEEMTGLPSPETLERAIPLIRWPIPKEDL